MRISDTDIVASVDPCAYTTHGGLNETFIVTTIDGKNIAGLHYQNRDLEYIASREKSAKKKRLMLTPDFSKWMTNVTIRSLG